MSSTTAARDRQCRPDSAVGASATRWIRLDRVGRFSSPQRDFVPWSDTTFRAEAGAHTRAIEVVMGTGPPQLENEPPIERPPRRRHRVRVAVAVVVSAVALFWVVVGLGMVIYHWQESRPIPSFASLADHPDPSLSGTVAYYDSQSGCIRIVAAAGQPSQQVWCLPKEGPSTWAEVGKPAGPQLVWRTGGRLEITMFRWTATADNKTAPTLRPGWQKVIDLRTGAVDNTPTAEVPSSPNLTTEPTTSPSGDRITWTTDPPTGKAKVFVTDASGSKRTLLAVHGPGEYTYQFGPVFWAPNYQWIAAADDGRILVITPTAPAVTRVLRTGTGGGAGGGTAGPPFAITTENILTPSK
jgi:hypothetical protein